MAESLIGQKFERLTVIADGPKVKGRATSVCKCDCGNPESIRVYNKYLKNGDTKSCGCLKREAGKRLQYKNLVGKTFGRLTVLEADGLAAAKG